MRDVYRQVEFVGEILFSSSWYLSGVIETHPVRLAAAAGVVDDCDGLKLSVAVGTFHFHGILRRHAATIEKSIRRAPNAGASAGSCASSTLERAPSRSKRRITF
jgi:hypothetical protein